MTDKLTREQILALTGPALNTAIMDRLFGGSMTFDEEGGKMLAMLKRLQELHPNWRVEIYCPTEGHRIHGGVVEIRDMDADKLVASVLFDETNELPQAVAWVALIVVEGV